MKENERIRRFAEALKVAISCIEDCEYASQKVCNSRIDAAITSWREYVEANNIDNLMKETKEERTSTDCLTVSPRGGSKTTYRANANIFKNIYEVGSGISRYEHINAKFIQLTGHTMDDLLEMFAAGYTLTPPKQQDLANISASIME